MSLPQFPLFKPLELGDREVIQPRLWAFQPQTSELTFTNLFIWRDHYRVSWSAAGEQLIFIGDNGHGPFALPPVGPGPRGNLGRQILTWLKEEKGASDSVIDRADKGLADEMAVLPGLAVKPVAAHFDYVYRTEDLIHLAGRRYHDKRNHLNSFHRSYRASYEALGAAHLADCFALAEDWCRLKRCQEDLNLMGEWDAVREALKHFQALELTGGVIVINGRVEAFSLGELLNRDTAVIHIEKANPEIRGLYPAINQQFCEHAWSGTRFVNREQDLGEPGLKAAKESYNPDHLVEKFRISLT